MGRRLVSNESLDGSARPQQLRLPMGCYGPDQRAYGRKTYRSCWAECSQSGCDDETATLVDEDSADDQQSVYSSSVSNDGDTTEVEEEDQEVEASAEPDFTCLVGDCYESFDSDWERRQHMDSHFEYGKKYQCTLCDVEFTHREDLEMHCKEAGAGACLEFMKVVGSGAEARLLGWEYFRLPKTMHWFWEPQYIGYVRRPRSNDPLMAERTSYRQLYGLPLD
ncbi:hypothetical protein OBBRIDRAFT_800673 [Obba rivulosa]|uniref:C2H2-type domain-containing protein n=1 Tax=Obba rivulosa TaxID=1052685 RepID=A0A8E2DTA2_9APHY|nr:hypothetical protein OBBRIDRAFT_800673 [Obba rivulosa]